MGAPDLPIPLEWTKTILDWMEAEGIPVDIYYNDRPLLTHAIAYRAKDLALALMMQHAKLAPSTKWASSLDMPVTMALLQEDADLVAALCAKGGYYTGYSADDMEIALQPFRDNGGGFAGKLPEERKEKRALLEQFVHSPDLARKYCEEHDVFSEEIASLAGVLPDKETGSRLQTVINHTARVRVGDRPVTPSAVVNDPNKKDTSWFLS